MPFVPYMQAWSCDVHCVLSVLESGGCAYGVPCADYGEFDVSIVNVAD